METTKFVWKILSLGTVDPSITDEQIVALTLCWSIVILIQFFVGVFASYRRNEYGKIWGDATEAFGSVYVLIYMPVMVIIASLEALVVLQFSFEYHTFIVANVVMGMYVILKGLTTINREKVVCPFGLMKAMQLWAWNKAEQKQVYFFEEWGQKQKAIWQIKKKQRKALQSC